MNTPIRLSMLALVAALAACGGGGGDDTPATPPTDSVPDSASASSTGMVAWLKRLAGIAPEDKEALDVGRFAPPRPDDTEPEAL
ncbi:MAG: hypothetical protein KIT35_04850 [Piscinibacter sp.]|uniref:hypothetical protein n=1 Tax=Piscinibacter TaxID=1114981 RepID=UPI000FDE38C4|nr:MULTISPECIES: hypothetical protein [Piscinibacter]MCW5663142.1 hypothetical protein [Piscinibacter sp.]